ncbi:MAG: hypothetical protein IJ700_08640 [Bacteroidaceae bacterium]|nr:hypothetical protein [Bacteroidaceae bacterium]
MNSNLKNKLDREARYLHIAIPYDKDDELITFDDGVMTELECDEEFVPPMLNAEDQMLEFLIDLKERKAVSWNYEYGYLRLWAKVCDAGTYTLMDAEEKPLCQICGYVPNKLIPPFEKGFGDYIELAINADGTVNDWPATPDFSEFIEEGQAPQPVKTNKWHRAEEALWRVKGLHLNKEETAWLIAQLQSV